MKLQLPKQNAAMNATAAEDEELLKKAVFKLRRIEQEDKQMPSMTLAAFAASLHIYLALQPASLASSPRQGYRVANPRQDPSPSTVRRHAGRCPCVCLFPLGRQFAG